MSSSEVSVGEKKPDVEFVFKQDLSLSSEDPPREEWSSLVVHMVEGNPKFIKAVEGLYDPGSGEICGKYIAFSTSSMVLAHPYYHYNAVVDPGISQALHNPVPKITYADDGQELYLELCKEMDLCPIRKFYRELLENTISLKYYGISLAGFRAMAVALKLNTNVKVLDLTGNWINYDGCYHLGDMLLSNCTLTEMNLCGCRIGPNGARLLLHNLHLNRALRVLNLSRNEISDEGGDHLAMTILKGADLTQVNLSRNSLTAKFIGELIKAFEVYNKITHLDLSFNLITSPLAVFHLCETLSSNRKLEELDLSWNALSGERVGKGLSVLIAHPSLRRILLRSNKLEGAAINAIATSLSNAPKLELLDLSNNPLTHSDTIRLLNSFKVKRVKLKTLLLENICVPERFVRTLLAIRDLSYRKDTVVVHGEVMTKIVTVGKDIREIVMDRAEYIGTRKRGARHIALIVLELSENNEQIDPKIFGMVCKSYKLNLDEDLVTLMSQLFSGDRVGQIRMIDLKLLADYVKRKWPDMKLPPPPPEPVSVKNVKSTKQKGKKK